MLLPHTFAAKISKGKWIPYPHLRYISTEITKAINKGNARLIIQAPPRHGKSQLISKYLPPWFLNIWPDKRVILTSYAAEIAAGWGREVRNLLAENVDVLDVQLSEDSTAKAKWDTKYGGGMMTAGVGGPITGRGADLAIIDDPVKNWEDAISTVKRETAVNWFNSTFYTRLEPNASIIILMTRWHEGDLAGWLIDEHEDDWQVINMPAIAEENDVLGREVGQALCPERYDIDALKRILRAVKDRVFNSLYQQRPAAQEGNIIRRDWIKYYKVKPEYPDEIIQSWDFAIKDKETADYTAGQVWARKGADMYLYDRVKEHAGFPKQIKMVKEMSAKYPDAYLKLIEDFANGSAIIAALEKEIFGLVPIRPSTDKMIRLVSVAAIWESGNVYLPDPSIAPWVTAFVEEVCAFPNAKNDDEVDAMTQALNRLVQPGTRLEDLVKW